VEPVIEVTQTLDLTPMLISFASGLAIFLYGLRKMTDALKIVAGERVKSLLASLTTNRFTAAFAGIVVTAVIQSSSVTTVLIVGFITAGVMSFSQAIGVILGANVGTTITAQIIAFKITNWALLLIAAGFFTEIVAKHPRVRQFGIMSMGLGLLYFGIELMSQAMTPLRTYEPFMVLMREMTNPLMGLLIGAVFTALVQSSLATTGIVIIMASQGFITLELAIAIIMGANVGTCATAYVSAIGKPREAMQAAVAHVLFNVLGVLLFVGFIPWLAELVRAISPVSVHLEGAAQMAADTPRQIANAHTVFNVLNLIVFLGFTNVLSRAVLRLVPAAAEPELKMGEPKYLDTYYLDQPAVALDRAKLEIVRIGEQALTMVRDSFPILTVGTRERIDSVEKRDDAVDQLHNAVILFLHKLASRDLVSPQPQNLYRYLSVANYLENIADVVEKGMVADSHKRYERKLSLSKATSDLFKDVYKEVFLIGQDTLTAFAENNIEKATQVLEARSHFNRLVERVRSHLYDRLTQEQPEHMVLYKIELNTIENYRRIHALFMRIAEVVIDGNSVADDKPTEAVNNDEVL
jgi:phosphate:Na+ symporter